MQTGSGRSVQKIVGDYVLQHMLYTWSDVAAASELSPKSVVRAQLNTNIIYEQLLNTCRRKPAHSLVLQSGIRRFSSESAWCLFFSQLLCRLLVILWGFFHWPIFSCQTWMTSEQKNSPLCFCCICWGSKVANTFLMPEIICKLRCWHQDASCQAGGEGCTCHRREVTQEVKPSQNARQRVLAVSEKQVTNCAHC